MKKFQRLEKLIGKDFVDFLKTKKIVVVGCGGVGGYVVEGLVRSNVGTLILIDYDVVDLTNCNRQIIAMNSTIGRLKVDVLKERIMDINDECKVICYQEKLSKENINSFIPKDTTYVIDACDDKKAKMAIISYCLKYHVPFITSMGTGKRLDPSKLEITTLDQTKNDSLARIMRKMVKDEKITEKISVCYSKELPKKCEDTTISSSSFVPGSAGFLIASFVVREILEKKL